MGESICQSYFWYLAGPSRLGRHLYMHDTITTITMRKKGNTVKSSRPCMRSVLSRLQTHIPYHWHKNGYSLKCPKRVPLMAHVRQVDSVWLVFGNKCQVIENPELFHSPWVSRVTFCKHIRRFLSRINSVWRNRQALHCGNDAAEIFGFWGHMLTHTLYVCIL